MPSEQRECISWRMTAPAAALFLSTILSTGHAAAWGPEGHAIVAEIAEARLTDAARAQVSQLLGQENHQHLDEVASWADDYRVSHSETAGWHFVDIPLGVANYDANRDCAGDNCVVAQIQHFGTVLGDKNAIPADRLMALKFVVHFVGDIHQPLHAEDHDDKGGNSVNLTYFGKSTNLHSVWDGRIIEQALGVTLGPNFAPDLPATQQVATVLGGNISANQAARWAPAGLTSQLDVVAAEWANESHALAQTAYRNLPPSRRPEGWDSRYQVEAWPVVEGQLTRAGVRLAEVLNEELQ